MLVVSNLFLLQDMLHAKAGTRTITRVFFFETIFFYHVIVMDYAWISSTVTTVCSVYNILVCFFSTHCAFAYNILGLENLEY